MKKLSKTLVSLMVAAVLITLSAISGFAVLMSYEINNIGLKIDIPNEYRIIMRDTPSDDPVFKQVGLDYNSVMSSLETSNVYLQGYSADNTKIIAVTMSIDDSSKEIVSYKNLEQSQLETIRQGFMVSDMYTDSDILENGEIKMIYLEFQSNANDVDIYGVQGNVVENGMNYNIVLQKTGSALTQSEKNEFTSIINSVEIREPDTGVFTGNIILTLLIVFLCAVVVILFVVIIKGRKKSSEEISSSNSRKLPSYIDGQEADDLMVVRAKHVEKHDYVTKSIDEAISDDKSKQENKSVKESESKIEEGKKEEYLDKFFDNKGENNVPERKEKKKNFFEKRQEKKQAEKREKSLEAFKNAEEYNVFDDQQKGDDEK